MAKQKWPQAKKDSALSLHAAGKSIKEIHESTGVPTGTLWTWIKSHTEKRDEAPTRPESPPIPPPRAERVDPPPTEDAPPVRDRERDPSPPDDARIQQPEVINYRQLGDYISGAYKMVGKFAEESGRDPVLGVCITEHADEAGKAWANWIESEPKVAAFLQRMMIATPAGELIRVHVAIGIGYFFARAAVADARAAAERQSDDGAFSAAA